MTIASLRAAIADRERVLLDSSTLIAYHTPFEAAHPLARYLLDRIADGADPLRVYCATISASELLIRPIRTSASDSTLMHQFLTKFPSLTRLPVDLVVGVEAATLRALTKARLPDALIVATGPLSNCEVIVSNDERWTRQFEPLFPQFRWLYLGDHLPA